MVEGDPIFSFSRKLAYQLVNMVEDDPIFSFSRKLSYNIN